MTSLAIFLETEEYAKTSPARDPLRKVARIVLTRRVVVCCGSIIAAASASGAARAESSSDAIRNMPPKPGDLVVAVGAETEGVPLRPADLSKGGDPTLAWPFDPQAKSARDGTRLNQIILMRLDPASFGPLESKLAADGVVAFSAICTHQGCTVTDWITAKRVLQCPCHQSEYDPTHAAKVVAGPAPRALPALPLKLENNLLTVAGEFTDRVGGERPQA